MKKHHQHENGIRLYFLDKTLFCSEVGHEWGNKYRYSMLSLSIDWIYVSEDSTDGCTHSVHTHYVVTDDTIIGSDSHGHVIKRPESKS